MAFYQTAYNVNQPAYAVGRVSNMETWNGISRTSETALPGIAFGVPVSQGSKDHACILTAAAGGVLGISVVDSTTNANALAPSDHYLQGASVSVLTMGVVAVVADKAIVVGGAARVPAFWNPATGFWTDDNTKLAVPGATFDTSAAQSGDLVLLRIK